jgi:amino acid transporter
LAILLALMMFHRHEVIGLLSRGGRWRVVGMFALLLGIMSIIGGIFALMRKAWGAALAGAITALYPWGIFGILAIIFVAMAKQEFSKPSKETGDKLSGS